jgi:hypothetical protein
VAVGAQQLQVLQPVVLPVAVYVMEDDQERGASPFGKTAQLAPVCLQPEPHEAHLDVTAVARLCQQVFERHAPKCFRHSVMLWPAS